MLHALPFLLAQALPYVSSAVQFTQPDPARAHTFTSTDYAIIAAVAVPAFAFAGSIVREHRRYALTPAELEARKHRFEPLVWVNTRSGIYYFEGDRWYKRTRQGMLLPLHVAKARGNRTARGTHETGVIDNRRSAATRKRSTLSCAFPGYQGDA